MAKVNLYCRACASENLVPFDAEASIHVPGLKGLHQPPIFAYPKLLVCLNCGFTETTFSEAELLLLKQGQGDVVRTAP
jgi:hypothetical protein